MDKPECAINPKAGRAVKTSGMTGSGFLLSSNGLFGVLGSFNFSSLFQNPFYEVVHH